MNLLSAVYELPKLALAYPFDSDQAARMGERWIAFHHLMPSPEILKWINETRPFLLTTVRHPGDVLISLYHHIHQFPAAPINLQELLDMLNKPFERFAIEPPAVHTFRDELECSLAWKRTGAARIVRYEDLRIETLRTVTSLTAWIQPVEQPRIEQAIEKCEINLMRSLSGKHKSFFRSGLVGEWIDTLSPEILEVFEAEPYASQIAELGYTLERNAKARLAPVPSGVRNPFRKVHSFENGVSVSPIIEDLHLSLDPAVNATWPEISTCGPRSFFAWMNSACEVPGLGRYADIFLSNLAHYIYRSRDDLKNNFPDLNGPNRAKYAEWFIQYAREVDDEIDSFFPSTVRNAFVRWGNARAKEDRVRRPWWPRLTCFAMYVYETKPEVQTAFPSPFSIDRWNFLKWLSDGDHGLEVFPELVDSVRADLKRCARLRSAIHVFWRR